VSPFLSYVGEATVNLQSSGSSCRGSWCGRSSYQLYLHRSTYTQQTMLTYSQRLQFNQIHLS